MRRVAHNENFLAAQISTEHTIATHACHSGDLITVFAVVGECAGLKDVPKAQATQLDFRAKANVAGDQAKQRRLRQRPQPV
jgi:hypothetical protein